MIGMRTRLEVADNSGARRLRCILPRGGNTGAKAGLGDIITASVQEATPESNVKKGADKAGRAMDATPFEVLHDTPGSDLVLSYAGRPGVLYRDRLGGRYEATTLEGLPAGAESLKMCDVNHDGSMDLLAVRGGEPLLIVNREGKLARDPNPPEFQARAGENKARATADYIAGMTDRYAMLEHRRLFAVEAT